tara:strand:+ start:232 stop:468 length:237 start_codon:yes stop_codon:yes gene_type:complete
MKNEQILKDFGDRIKSLRKGKNLSQEQLSFEIGFHRTYIGMVERGERNLSLSNIKVFSDYFDLSLSDLFNSTEFKKIN